MNIREVAMKMAEKFGVEFNVTMTYEEMYGKVMKELNKQNYPYESLSFIEKGKNPEVRVKAIYAELKASRGFSGSDEVRLQIRGSIINKKGKELDTDYILFWIHPDVLKDVL